MLSDLNKSLEIRPASAEDAGAVASIYNHYIVNTPMTFEEKEVSETEISRRIQDVGSASPPWLIAEQSARVVGYSYAESGTHAAPTGFVRKSRSISTPITPEAGSAPNCMTSSSRS